MIKMPNSNGYKEVNYEIYQAAFNEVLEEL